MKQDKCVCGAKIKDDSTERFGYKLCLDCDILARIYFEGFLGTISKRHKTNFKIKKTKLPINDGKIKTKSRNKNKNIYKSCSSIKCPSLFIDSKTKDVSCVDGINPLKCEKLQTKE